MLPLAIFLLTIPLLCLSQDGSISGPTSSSDAAGYSCDPSRCKLPNCNCASTSPPGGLSPSDTPMFIVFNAHDFVQSYTLDGISQFIGQRKNPNGCLPKTTFFTSLNFTNYTLVTDYYVLGNEIADHTMTHVGNYSNAEVDGNLIALNAFAGIPFTSIQGFRAPLMNITTDTLKHLASSGFTYDSSTVASLPVNASYTDAFWPYTLDNGLANSCLTIKNACKGQPQIPGFWEMPLYAFFDRSGVSGPHLMDPWLDAPNNESSVDDAATLAYMKDNFMAHYNGNRQPIGIYMHPIHLSKTYPGIHPPQSTIDMINAFLDWAQEQPNVWIVNNQQLLAWVRNPVPLSQLDSFAPLKCSTPQVDSSRQICNGIPQNEKGLLQQCHFNDSDYSFFTCYGCPVSIPSPGTPNPPQVMLNDSNTDAPIPQRVRINSNCTTPFWDPIAGNCICTPSTCAFQDNSQPIGPNGANLTGGNSGSAFNPTASTKVSFTPLNGAIPASLPAGLWPTIVLSWTGMIMGTVYIFGRL